MRKQEAADARERLLGGRGSALFGGGPGSGAGTVTATPTKPSFSLGVPNALAAAASALSAIAAAPEPAATGPTPGPATVPAAPVPGARGQGGPPPTAFGALFGGGARLARVEESPAAAGEERDAAGAAVLGGGGPEEGGRGPQPPGGRGSFAARLTQAGISLEPEPSPPSPQGSGQLPGFRPPNPSPQHASYAPASHVHAAGGHGQSNKAGVPSVAPQHEGGGHMAHNASVTMDGSAAHDHSSEAVARAADATDPERALAAAKHASNAALASILVGARAPGPSASSRAPAGFESTDDWRIRVAVEDLMQSMLDDLAYGL